MRPRSTQICHRFLDSIFATLHIDPLDEGVQIVAAAQIAAPAPFSALVPFASTRPLLISGLADRAALQRVQTALRTLYSDSHDVRLVQGQAVARQHGGAA